MSKDSKSLEHNESRPAAIQLAIVTIACSALLTLGAGGCGSASATDGNGDSDEAKVETVVETIQVTKQKHTVKVVVPASVEGYEMALLKSRVEGYVKKVNANIGDVVPQTNDMGMAIPLAELDVPELHADKARLAKFKDKAVADKALRDAEKKQVEAKRGETEAMLKLREAEYKRVAGLVRSGALNAEKLNEANYALQSALAAKNRIEADILAAAAMVDSADAEIGVADANVAKAGVMISYLNIDAPFNGIITERLVDPGAYVEPASNGGSPLFRIERVDKVRIVMYVPMDDAVELSQGDAVVLQGVHGKPHNKFEGQIARLSKSFNRQTRMMRVEVDRDNPVVKGGRRELLPGDYGKATITLNEYDALESVPASAVADDGEGQYVVEVDDDNVCRFRRVLVKATKKGKDDSPDVLGITNGDGTPFSAKRVISSNVAEYKDKDGEKLHAVSTSTLDVE